MIALLAAAFAGQDPASMPPATPTYHLDGPLNVCAEEFSVRLVRGESISWRMARRSFIRYAIRTGEIEATVGWGAPYTPRPLTTVTALRLPLSPITRRYVVAIPDRTERDTQGNQRDGFDYAISWYLFGATSAGVPVIVWAQSGDRRLDLPFVRRIDPRPARARNCMLSRFDPALAHRIVVSPGR
jgi:hypothetical protein